MKTVDEIRKVIRDKILEYRSREQEIVKKYPKNRMFRVELTSLTQQIVLLENLLKWIEEDK